MNALSSWMSSLGRLKRYVDARGLEVFLEYKNVKFDMLAIPLLGS
jgi:hypothetical protein